MTAVARLIVEELNKRLAQKNITLNVGGRGYVITSSTFQHQVQNNNP